MNPKISKQLTSPLIKTLFEDVTTVLFDADGVLWVEDNPLPGAIETFNKLVQLGKRVIIVTNNSSKTRDQYKVKCDSLGFNVSIDQIMSTSHATAWYLAKMKLKGKVYLMGNPAVAKDLDERGIQHVGLGPDPWEITIDTNLPAKAKEDLVLDPDVSAVVVGFDKHFNMVKMLRATSYIMGKGAFFLATNEDQQLPLGGDIVFPGTGAIVGAVSIAANKKPDVVVGKPHKAIFECLQETHDIDPSHTVMIGDRLNTDILFGRNNAMRTILVLTGCSTMDEVIQCENSEDQEMRRQVPNYYIESVGAIGTGL